MGGKSRCFSSSFHFVKTFIWKEECWPGFHSFKTKSSVFWSKIIHDVDKETQILKEVFALGGNFSAEIWFISPNLKSLSNSKDWFSLNYVALISCDLVKFYKHPKERELLRDNQWEREGGEREWEKLSKHPHK